MYKYIINIIIAFVVKANRINLGINNNKYELGTFGASLLILIQTLFKSISKNKKNYQTYASLSGTLLKEEGFPSKSKQAAILKSTYQKVADQTTSFLICVIILWLSNGKKRKRW